MVAKRANREAAPIAEVEPPKGKQPIGGQVPHASAESGPHLADRSRVVSWPGGLAAMGSAGNRDPGLRALGAIPMAIQESGQLRWWLLWRGAPRQRGRGVGPISDPGSAGQEDVERGDEGVKRES